MSDVFPRQNIEVKARCPDLNRAREVCDRIGAQFQRILKQTDTYFPGLFRGSRTKLRQINDARFEMINYRRANKAATRSSLYDVRTIDAKTAERILKQGKVLCVVRKCRDLYLWHNVRIHLDQVEGLGNFIEFEGVISSDADPQISRERVSRLVTEFAISPTDQIGVSYSDLLMAK
jgi:predicted adenylyl cyclase CyaB